MRPEGFEAAFDDRYRRLQRVGPQRTLRKTAEHEAAHATVAEALGYRVYAVVAGADGVGHVGYEKASREHRAAIAVAGGLWITMFRSMEYPEGDSGCGQDHRTLGLAADGFGARQAIGRATQILREQRAAVLALADRGRAGQHGRPVTGRGDSVRGDYAIAMCRLKCMAA